MIIVAMKLYMYLAVHILCALGNIISIFRINMRLAAKFFLNTYNSCIFLYNQEPVSQQCIFHISHNFFFVKDLTRNVYILCTQWMHSHFHLRYGVTLARSKSFHMDPFTFVIWHSFHKIFMEIFKIMEPALWFYFFS